MNIEKLEAILEEMRRVPLTDLAAVQQLVHGWADRIDGAIHDHLLEQIGGVAPQAPALAIEPGGHGWE